MKHVEIELKRVAGKIKASWDETSNGNVILSEIGGNNEATFIDLARGLEITTNDVIARMKTTGKPGEVVISSHEGTGLENWSLAVRLIAFLKHYEEAWETVYYDKTIEDLEKELTSEIG